MTSPWARLALNSLRVVSPWMVSRKWALIRARRRHWRWLRASAPLPIRIMKSGIRGAVISRTRAESQSRASTASRMVRGTRTARALAGQVTGIVGLQVLDPLNQGLHQGPAALPGDIGGSQALDVANQSLAQGQPDPGPAAKGGALRQPGERGAPEEEPQQRPQPGLHLRQAPRRGQWPHPPPWPRATPGRRPAGRRRPRAPPPAADRPRPGACGG